MKKKTLLLLSIPLLFGAFLLFMIHYSTEYAAEHEEVEHLHNISGRFALIGKGHTDFLGSDTVYTLHLIGDSSGGLKYFTYWTRCLDFLPSPIYIRGRRNPNPIIARWYNITEKPSQSFSSFRHQHYLVVCSKEDYDSVQVGDYIGVDGTYDDQTPENGMVAVTRQKGPMFNYADGLILWLYRDLPEE